MAISGGDGSIILTTSVDTSGISKGTVSIRSALQGVDSTVKKVQNSFSAFREQKVTLATLNQAIKDQQYVLNSLNLEYAEYVARGKASSAEAKALKTNIDAATAEMKEMQAATVTLGAKGSTSINKIGIAMRSLLSYFIGIQTIFKVINFSGEAANFATQTEASVQRLVDIYGEASESVGNFIDANARAIGMSKSTGSSIAATYGNLLSVWADQSTNAELTNSLLNQTAVVASKTGRTVEDVAERIRSGLLGNTEAIEDLGINVNIKTIEITDAFKRIADGRSWNQLNANEQSQVRTLAILEQSTNKYGTTVAETSATARNQYQAAYEDFQNTWGQIVNTVLIPALNVLTQIFTVATKGLQVIAGLSGKTVSNSKIQESSIGGSVENQKALTEAIEETNKAQKKSLAGFDEINILSQDTAGNGQTGQVGTNAVETNTGVAEIGGVEGGYDNSFVEQISGDMAAIMAIIGGALVAVGLLLIFFGNIGWGIGFIIAGVAIFAVSMATVASSDQSAPISEQLMTILAIAGIALTAIGLILLFSGIWQWGIGFIIAGAAALGVAIVATESGNVDQGVEETLLNIMTIAGAAMLALGVILLCFGVVSPLSIGLVVAGAASLAGAIALNPQLVFENISNFLTDNAGLIVGISLSLLVLGIVLCVCGIVTPLSIGMIVLGAAGLAAEIALNWNYIVDSITNFFRDNGDLIIGVSIALMIIGIILLLTGVGIPLAIGLIVAGGGLLAAEAVLNWNYLVDTITNFFKENTGLIVGVSIALIILGIILLFTGVGIPLAIGLIIAGGGLLAAEVALNWNFIVEKLGEVWDNVKKFWNTYIAPVFTASFWLDLAKKCGNGLIGGFEAAINGIITMFENMINWVIGGINKISFDIPDWLGGGHFGFNLSKVSFSRVSFPRLAEGTVVPPNREFLAVLGDNKKEHEIVSPLSTMKQAFMEAMVEMGGSYGGGNTEVILQIDGREFGRAVIEQGNKEKRRIGTRLVIV